MADQLSAELDARFSAGPPSAGTIVKVRDLIVCAGDPSLDVPIEEVYAHPPIGWDRHPGMDEERALVSLSTRSTSAVASSSKNSTGTPPSW